MLTMVHVGDETRQSRWSGWLRRAGWGHRGYRVWSRRQALVGLVLLLIVPCVLDQVRFQLAPERMGLDLGYWCQLSRVFLADPAQPIYDQYPRYLYPPCYLLLFRPLAALSLPAAALVFEIGKWIALFLSLWITWRIASPRGEDLPPVASLGSLVLTWRFLANDISQANINLFLLLGIVAGGWLFARGRAWSAGVLLGATACIKVTPALLIVYFAYRRQWRVVIAAILAAVGLFALPMLVVGWANNWHAITGWYHHVVGGFLSKGSVYSPHINQSLTAILNRLFGAHVAIEPDQYVTWVVLPIRVLNALRGTLSVMILLTLAWACRGRRETMRSPLVFTTEIGLVLIAMLLLSGYSWKAHFVVLLVPYTAMLAYLADARFPGPKRLVSVLLLASFALSTLTSDFLGPRGADLAEAYGLVALGAVAAGAGLLVIRSRLRQASEACPR